MVYAYGLRNIKISYCMDVLSHNYSPEIIIENSRDEMQMLRKRNLQSFIILNSLFRLLLLKHR